MWTIKSDECLELYQEDEKIAALIWDGRAYAGAAGDRLYCCAVCLYGRGVDIDPRVVQLPVEPEAYRQESREGGMGGPQVERFVWQSLEWSIGT